MRGEDTESKAAEKLERRGQGRGTGRRAGGDRRPEELLVVAGARAGVNLPSLLFEAVEPLS